MRYLVLLLIIYSLVSCGGESLVAGKIGKVIDVSCKSGLVNTAETIKEHKVVRALLSQVRNDIYEKYGHEVEITLTVVCKP